MVTRTESLPAAAPSAWLAILAGLCASLVSIGLARFAYTPLIPSLIDAHWFGASQVIYLSAANLAGYLIGALSGRPIAHRLSNVQTLQLMMVVVTLSFFACAFPVSLSWFFFWRLLSGIAGGAIMVLVASTVLPHVPPARKGLASGAIFLGVGLGIVGSGTIVPLLLAHGLRATWIGLGSIALVLSAISWFGWPRQTPIAATTASTAEAEHNDTASNADLYLLFAQYALIAAGLVPAMVFLVDYVARALGEGAHVGAMIWVMYGLGATLGPVIYGALADRLGARVSIRLVLLAQAVAMGLLSLVSNAWILAALAVIIGSLPSGSVALALSRVHELVPTHSRQQAVWSQATVSFATAQALTGFAYSAIFNASGQHHTPLFIIATAALALALIMDYAAAWISKSRRGSSTALCSGQG